MTKFLNGHPKPTKQTKTSKTGKTNTAESYENDENKSPRKRGNQAVSKRGSYNTKKKSIIAINSNTQPESNQ